MSKQAIYNTLLQSGMTEAGALGMMGNFKCESGLEANRLQGDFGAFRTISKSFVQRVTSGDIGRDQFARQGRGFGLAQWTYYTRLYALWDFWKESGKALDDPVMQTQFAVAELKEDYRSLWEELCYNTDIYTCTKLVCEQYERPAHNNIDARYRAALALKEELEKEPEPVKDEVYWPPRMICKGMSGPDVSVLQALLTARGFICDITGEFDVKTHNMTIAFQSEQGLVQDGIAGPRTWSAILERG